MGKFKKTKKFAEVKRLMSPKDPRLKENQEKAKRKEKMAESRAVTKVESTPSSLFFAFNAQLGPPYRVLMDTNFINFSVQNKLDVKKSLMDCLLAEVIPLIPACVIAELEKIPKFRLALRVARSPDMMLLPCTHRGTYADDCIVARVSMHRCYIVATNDKALQKRIRKIPGVPILSVAGRKYKVERLPDTSFE